MSKVGPDSPIPASPEDETRRMERKIREYTALFNRQ